MGPLSAEWITTETEQSVTDNSYLAQRREVVCHVTEKHDSMVPAGSLRDRQASMRHEVAPYLTFPRHSGFDADPVGMEFVLQR